MRLTLTGGGCEIKRTAPPVRGFLARPPLTGRSRPVASSSRASGPAECWNSRPAPRVLSPDPRAVPNVHDAGSSVQTEERAMIETVRHAGTTVRTALIPAAGWGTRSLPASKAVPKEMLPIVDKPLIQYAVEEAFAAGIERVVLVLSPGKQALVNHFQRPDNLVRDHAATGKTDEIGKAAGRERRARDG